MTRMTKTEALALVQAAYDALDSFDSSSLHSVQCDMMDARHHLRELKIRYFGALRSKPGKYPGKPVTAPLTGLEQELPLDGDGER